MYDVLLKNKLQPFQIVPIIGIIMQGLKSIKRSKLSVTD